MLDTIIKLLERFVVAHELIAANSAKQPAELISVETRSGETLKEKATEDAKKDESKDEPEEKPAKAKRGAKKQEPKAPDLEELRDDIKTMAKAIAAGDSDECADLFEDMLDEFKVRNVGKLTDEDVPDFHAELKALVAKHYEIEE